VSCLDISSATYVRKLHPATKRLCRSVPLETGERCVVDSNEVHFEYESRVGGNDVSDFSGSVTLARGNSELGFFAQGQLGNTVIPTLDHLTHTNSALEGLSAIIRAIELFAVGEGAEVVDPDFISWLRFGSVAGGDTLDGGRGHGGYKIR